jgi:putative transposase
MTAALDGVTKRKSAEQRPRSELVRQVKAQGLSLTGPDGLLKQLTKAVLKTALGEEMTDLSWIGMPGLPGCGTRRRPA